MLATAGAVALLCKFNAKLAKQRRMRLALPGAFVVCAEIGEELSILDALLFFRYAAFLQESCYNMRECRGGLW